MGYQSVEEIDRILDAQRQRRTAFYEAEEALARAKGQEPGERQLGFLIDDLLDARLRLQRQIESRKFAQAALMEKLRAPYVR